MSRRIGLKVEGQATQPDLSTMKKADIIARLDDQGVEYDERAKKEELAALLARQK